jgi:hypothetical protein
MRFLAKRTPLWLWATLSIAVLLGGLLWLLQQEESFERAGRRIVGAIESGNGSRLVAYMDAEELERSTDSPEAVTRLLREFVVPKIQGFQHSKSATIETSETATHYTQYYRHPDGRQIGIALALHRNGKKVVAHPVLQRLVDTSLRAEVPAGKPQPIQRDKLVWMLEKYPMIAPQLEDIGLRSLCEVEHGVLECTPWSQYRDKIAASLVRFDEREAIARASR